MASVAVAFALLGCDGAAPPRGEEGTGGIPSGDGPPSRVILDGAMDDWEGVPRLVEDDGDPGGTPVLDLEALSVTDDPAWLFLQLDVGEATNLQAMPGTITLMVDADGDPGTGGAMEGMEGVEFAVDLSPRRDPAAQEYGAGFSVRLPDGSRRTPYDVGLAGFPTYAAERFELRLSRRPRAGLPPLGSTVRLGVVAWTDPGGTESAPGTIRVVDRLSPTRYRAATAPGPDPFAPDLDRLSPPEAGAFRVAAWNVGSETFRDADAFAAVLGLVQPDVILLDEVYEDVSREELEAFFQHPALAALGEWAFVLSRGGGRQKTVVAARNRALRQEPTMAEVAYAPGALDALRSRTPEAFHRALDYEARVNLSATGAWVEVDPEGAPGREVLFVPVDLQSAGWNGSPQDALRLLQARTLLAHVREAIRGYEGGGEPASGEGTGIADLSSAAVRRGTGGPPPVVVAGDLNLVGGRGPLDLLLAGDAAPSGPPVTAGPLGTASAPRLDEATWATWLSERQALFGPGRLDYALYSRETLEQVGGFVLGSTGLSDEELAVLGTDRAAMAQLEEDHLPLVVDLRLRAPRSP